jgi:hypothetical protein
LRIAQHNKNGRAGMNKEYTGKTSGETMRLPALYFNVQQAG